MWEGLISDVFEDLRTLRRYHILYVLQAYRCRDVLSQLGGPCVCVEELRQQSLFPDAVCEGLKPVIKAWDFPLAHPLGVLSRLMFL